jgi:hypothetical protein
MRNKFLYLFFFLFLFQSCNYRKPETNIIENTSKIESVYRVFLSEKDNFNIWIVDGYKIRMNIFPEFLYGGNPERYIFIPEGEIWIDNTITSEEIIYTLEHEICERNLMYNSGYSYFDAHDSALKVEQSLRLKNEIKCKNHELEIPKVSPIDFDSTKEIEYLPDQIKLKNIYRQFYQIKDGISVWIVDGSAIRRDIYPDFGFSGNDLAYRFIPDKEIWIDAQVSCEELIFSIELELNERKELSSGLYYDRAYEIALEKSSGLRKINSDKCIKTIDLNKNQIIRDTGRGVLLKNN